MDELDMQRAEAQIPELAARAGRAAHERTLMVRGQVTMAVGSELVIKRLDGTVTPLGHLKAPVKVVRGQVLRRRSK